MGGRSTAAHPEGRTALFVGDLVDRGPDTPGVLRLVMGMVAAGTAMCVAGNHEDKLLRALNGRRVQVKHGLAESLAQLGECPDEFRTEVVGFLDGLISHYVLDGGRLVVAHAGLKEAYQGRASGRVRSFCLYGETTGETDEYGLPVRYPWANEYRGTATVVYGHTPTLVPEWVNNTICVDTGAVFGGSLTALRYPSRELVSVPAAEVYYEPAKPLLSVATRPAESLLSISDVSGRRFIETGYGRVTVPAENAAAALEVMGRFAIDPADLLWLPPTMAPCSTSTVDGYLEYPTGAFEDYRRAGVTRVVCEEKHMGSRAVALVRQDGTGALYTRTGRAFFPADELNRAALVRLRPGGHHGRPVRGAVLGLGAARRRSAALVGQGDGTHRRSVRQRRRRGANGAACRARGPRRQRAARPRCRRAARADGRSPRTGRRVLRGIPALLLANRRP